MFSTFKRINKDTCEDNVILSNWIEGITRTERLFLLMSQRCFITVMEIHGLHWEVMPTRWL